MRCLGRQPMLAVAASVIITVALAVAPAQSATASEVPTDPDEAYQQALEGAQTVAVAEAQRLLAEVTADLNNAQNS